MLTVTVTQNLELPLPASLCESLRITPGQKIHLEPRDNSIEVIPQFDIKEAHGFLRGIDSRIENK